MWTETPPEETGYYWHKPADDGQPFPAYVGLGPFGNTAFIAGRGWRLKDRVGGLWWPEKLIPPESQENTK